MLSLKDQGEILVIASIPGAAAADLNVFQFVIPFPVRLKSIYAKATVAGITGNGTYDINKNGTTIFSSSKVGFATTSQDPTYGALTADPLDFVKGDIVSIDCDAVHSGTPLDGVCFEFVFQRHAGVALTAATITGSAT